MSIPRTKAELLKRMEARHQEYYKLLSRIPLPRMTEIALYDTWTVKDLIAHIGWWAETGVERVAAVRRGEPEQALEEVDPINAQILDTYRTADLSEVLAMDARGWEGLKKQVQEATEEELFNPHQFPLLEGEPLVRMIIEESYGHYDDHLDDLEAWMKQPPPA